MIDEIDRKLLELLQSDYRASYHELGAAVGLSISGVNARLKRLTAEGVLRGGGARVNPAAVDRDLCAFVQVLLDRPECDEPFIAAMRANPVVMECHHTTGEFSYLVKVRVAGTSQLEQFITRGVKSLPGVARTYTTIALSSPKESDRLDLRTVDSGRAG